MQQNLHIDIGGIETDLKDTLAFVQLLKSYIAGLPKNEAAATESICQFFNTALKKKEAGKYQGLPEQTSSHRIDADTEKRWDAALQKTL